ncbi:hypothetical protein J7438_27210, partial [Thalassotalea sp. G20_0]|uniref:hypothetical protein n=1 Tax=Thalassotalea sp. G20_0 TaxID=2821093 RepID=UPI001ADAD179
PLHQPHHSALAKQGKPTADLPLVFTDTYRVCSLKKTGEFTQYGQILISARLSPALNIVTP